MKKAFLLGFFMLLIPFALFAQKITVRGKVVYASDGSPMPGANVFEQGTTNGTIADLNGEYSLTVPSNAVIVVSFYKLQSQTIEVQGRTQLPTIKLSKHKQKKSKNGKKKGDIDELD